MSRSRLVSLMVLLPALLLSGVSADDRTPPQAPPSPVEWLLAQQREDGAFGAVAERRFQTTAFVVIALSDARVVRRTDQVKRALARAIDHLVSFQNDQGAFLDRGVDRTLLGLLALISYRDGAKTDADVRTNLRAALPLLPSDLLHVLEDAPPAGADDDGALLHAAFELGAVH